jgi:hypothetical protein
MTKVKIGTFCELTCPSREPYLPAVSWALYLQLAAREVGTPRWGLVALVPVITAARMTSQINKSGVNGALLFLSRQNQQSERGLDCWKELKTGPCHSGPCENGSENGHPIPGERPKQGLVILVPEQTTMKMRRQIIESAQTGPRQFGP